MSPAVPTGDGGVGAPGGGDGVGEIFAREFGEVVDALDLGADAEVVPGEDIEATEGEDEIHLSGPDTDTGDLREAGDDFLIGAAIEGAEVDEAVVDLGGEVEEVAAFLLGDADGTEFCRGKLCQRRGGDSLFASEFFEAAPENAGDDSGDLLTDDGAGEHGEMPGIAFHQAGADAVDDLAHAAVFFAEVFDGGIEMGGGD